LSETAKEEQVGRIKIQIGLWVVMLIVFSSCSTYYYSTLSSADSVGDRTREGDFVQQNDTATVIYSFSGEDAPVHITIYNKLDEPLYIDWGRSSIIIDEKATSYGGEETYQTEDDTYFTSSHVEMIPPYSMIQHQPLTLANFSFNKIPNKEYRRIPYSTGDGEYVHIRMKEYTLEDTPLYFRSYLTLFTGGKEGTLPHSLTFEKSFFVSQLVKAGDMAPKNYVPANRGDGDTFYVRYVKGRNVGYAVASIAVIVGVIAVEVAVGPVDEYD